MKKTFALILIFLFSCSFIQAQFGKIGDFLSEISLKGKAQTQFELGINKFEQRDFAGATLHFEKVVELKPRKNIGWRFQGLTKLTWGDLQGDLADFDQTCTSLSGR